MWPRCGEYMRNVTTQVVSGLVKFIPLEEMTGRRVVIVANLKPENLRGIRSQAIFMGHIILHHGQA